MGRALIAEDAEPVRRLLKILLEREGLQVDTAKSGREALDHLRVQQFDLILLDLMMPEISGYEVLYHLSVHSPETLNKLILITAASERDLARRLPRERGLTIIRKPFDIKQITNAVRERMGTKPSRVFKPIDVVECEERSGAGEPSVFGLDCMLCDTVGEFKNTTERLAWEHARQQGWHIVAFLREDTASGKVKRQLITFCPACARPSA